MGEGWKAKFGGKHVLAMTEPELLPSVFFAIGSKNRLRRQRDSASRCGRVAGML
jgi:ribosomal protein L20A (L18A)